MKVDPIPVQAVPRLLVRLPEAAVAVGIAPRTFQRLLAAGEVGPRPIKLHGSTVFNLDELRAWAGSAVDGRLPDRAAWAARRREVRP